MSDNLFDPSKLNFDLDTDKTKQEIEKEEKNDEIIDVLETKEEQIAPEIIVEKEEKNDSLDSFLSDLEQVNSDIKEVREEKDDILADLSTIVTDPSLQTPEQKQVLEQKIEEKNSNYEEKQTIIYDMNILSIDDLIKICFEKSYDFFILDPKDEYVKISFVANQVEKESRNIKFPIYSNLLIKTKNLSKLNLEQTNIEQKGETEHQAFGKNFKLTIKIVPGQAGEKLFVKANMLENKNLKQAKKQSGVSMSQAVSFLGIIFVIALILGSAFIAFVVMNARSVDDVQFFRSLGINLGDINNFLQKLTTIIFSILVFVETIFLIIFIFKTLNTKKEFKAQKTRYTIIAIFFLIITFSTASAWMLVDKKIKSLPNWQEELLGDIKMFDNDKLLSPKYFERENSAILDSSNLIGPITIKYDLNRFGEKQANEGFKIDKFIWDFGNGDKAESLTAEFIKTFDKIGVYEIKLDAVGKNYKGEIVTIPVQNVPAVSITSLVNIEEKEMPSGGKTIVFDASSLKNLGELNWYMMDNMDTPAFVGPIFRPAKVFFDNTLVGLYIKREGRTDEVIDKVFLITRDDAADIGGQIKSEQSLDDDMTYKFSVSDPKADFGNGFIKEFKWQIGQDIISKDADLNDLSKSSEITYTFKDFGEQQVKLTIIDSAGKMKQLTQTINVSKRVEMNKKLSFSADGEIIDYDYSNLAKEYTIKSLGTPTKLNIDASGVRTDQSIYILKDANWDTNGDGKTDKTGKEIDIDINTPGIINMSVEYTFFRINKRDDEIKVKEMININAEEKDENLSLKVDQDSEYAPTKVSFDASNSKIKGEDIVKFAYDYGDGSPVDIRDAINPGHIYTKDGDYTVKLTVTTATGKQYSIEKKVIVKPTQKTAKIDVSMKETTIGQTISFESKNSIGQISTYSWDFGDGEISSEANPSHAYRKPGTYKVKLTLDFADNNQMTDEIEINIID